MAGLTKSEGMNMLRFSKNFDFHIECNGHVFNVHKDLISAKSDYLAVCVSGHFREGRDNRYITKTAKPYPVALALLFIYTGSFDVAGVGEVWPSVANLKIDNKDPEYFNLTSLIQLFALADIWGLHNLKQPVQDGVLHWGLKKHQYEWPVEEVQDNEAFRPIVLNILKAIFANTTEGSSLRTLAVGRGSRLANPKLWHLNYYNASKDFEEEKLHWCESVRKFLEDEEPFALAACTVLYELC